MRLHPTMLDSPRPPADNGTALAVRELDVRIQSDGPAAGTPAVVITMDAADAPRLTIVELQQWIERQSLPTRGLIVLTGREPLLQNVTSFVRLAHSRGFDVQIETRGEHFVEGLNTIGFSTGRRALVCTPLSPTVHPLLIPVITHWRYLIRAGETYADGLPTIDSPNGRIAVARPWDGRGTCDLSEIFVQPLDEGPTGQTEANVREAARVALSHGYRLCPTPRKPQA